MSMSYEIAEESHRLLLERLFNERYDCANDPSLLRFSRPRETIRVSQYDPKTNARFAVYEARLKVREAKAVFDNETRRLAADVVAKDADLAAKELVAIAEFEKFAKETRDAEMQESAVRMSRRVVCNNSFNPS